MAWYDGSWDYRVKITVASSQVDATLSNFPVYVDLSDLPADFHTNVKSDGGDIRVTSSDGSTELARELVFYDSSTDTGELHFNASSLSSSADTDFYIYYGNAAASDYAITATYGAENVWDSNFVAVYHFQQAATATNLDSTSNSNDLSPSGMDTADSVDGKLSGKALNFDAGGERVTASDSASMDWSSGTVTAWAQTDTLTSDGTIYSKGQGSGSEILLWFDEGVDDFVIGVDTNSGFDNGSSGGSYTTRSTSTWYHVAARYDAGSIDMRVNDASNYTSTLGTAIANNTSDVGLGDQAGGSRSLNGKIDELRVSDVARSDAWISAEYVNQNSTSTFYTAGTQETGSTAPTVALNTPTDTATGVSTTPTLEFTGTDADGDDVRYNVQLDYYEDFTGISDPDSQWTNDANGFDGSNSSETTTFSNGSTTTNYIFAQGTTAPTTGSSISQVRARVIDAGGANSYITLSAPSGGWTWPKVNGLAVLVWRNNALFGEITAEILSDGVNLGTALGEIAGPSGFSKIEIEVTHSGTDSYYFDASGTTLLDKVSGTDSGFANTVTPADTDPFNSGEKADYDIQAGDTLSSSTTYYWRVRAIDPSGTNTYGAWSTTRSFTTGAGGTETADTAAVTATHSVPSTTATYDEVVSAGVAVISNTITAQGATVTYVSVQTAGVAVISSTITPQDATATYDAVQTADTAEVATTLTAQDVTANYDAVVTAGVAEITNTITGIDVTATYIQVETASVAVVATTLSVQDATATYTSGSVAGVDVITLTLSEPGVTATYNQTETASLAVVDTTLTVQDATATYIQVETASLAVISNTFNIPAVTATQTTGTTADVAVVDTTLSPPATTATYDSIQTASLTEISNTLSAQDVTAAYDAIVSADVAVVANTLSVPSVTATSTDTHTALSDVVTITLTPTTANPLHNGYTTLPSLMFDIDGNVYKRLQSDRLVKL